MFIFLTLLAFVRSEESLKEETQRSERLKNIEEWKQEIENFRATKKKLIGEMKELKLKISEGRKNGEDITELTKQLDEIRAKLQKADEEFREARNKRFERDAGHRKLQVNPEFKKQPVKRFDRDQLEKEIRQKREQIAKKIHGPSHKTPTKESADE